MRIERTRQQDRRHRHIVKVSLADRIVFEQGLRYADVIDEQFSRCRFAGANHMPELRQPEGHGKIRANRLGRGISRIRLDARRNVDGDDRLAVTVDHAHDACGCIAQTAFESRAHDAVDNTVDEAQRHLQFVPIALRFKDVYDNAHLDDDVAVERRTLRQMRRTAHEEYADLCAMVHQMACSDEGVAAVVAASREHAYTLARDAAQVFLKGGGDFASRILHQQNLRHAVFLDGSLVDLLHLICQSDLHASPPPEYIVQRHIPWHGSRKDVCAARPFLPRAPQRTRKDEPRVRRAHRARFQRLAAFLGTVPCQTPSRRPPCRPSVLHTKPHAPHRVHRSKLVPPA